MLELVSILFGGAGGGVFGMLAGLFKNRNDNKHREEMARIANDRDEMEYQRQRESEEHRLEMLEATGRLNLEQTATEGAIQVDIANQQARGQAQKAEFDNLQTSGWMDNFRASVRPTLAYYFTVLFSVLLAWAFKEFSGTITDDMGGKILLGLFVTLEFAVTSILNFYYVSRRNPKPQL